MCVCVCVCARKYMNTVNVEDWQAVALEVDAMGTGDGSRKSGDEPVCGCEQNE